jgi:hypothetical protein
MEMRRFLILIPAVFTIVAMLVSCTSHKRPTYTWPSTFTKTPAIKTTMIEVTGDKRETLRVQFNLKGDCEQSWVNDKETNCAGIKLTTTHFCIPPPDDKHPANTDIYNDGGEKLDAYCGDIHSLTDGTDIKFKAKARSAAGNKKCKNVGGIVMCF